MSYSVVNQDVNVRQWKLILGTRLVQVPIVDAHADSSVFFGHWDDICKPLRVKDDLEEVNAVLLHDLFFDHK